MVNEAKGKLFRRKDGKYLFYVSTDLIADSMFPFRVRLFIPIGVGFKLVDDKLEIEKWKKIELQLLFKS